MALTEEKFNSLVQSLLSKKNIKHVIAGAASGDDSIRLISAAGVADANQTMMQKNTPFFIASITKLFISVTLMKLYEDGRIKLDNPISKLLPEKLVRGIHKLNGVDHSGKITVHHLLNHSSGLPDWIEDRPKSGKSFVERIETEKDRIITIEEILSIVRDNLQPHFSPQQIDKKRIKIRYSDTNYHLLMAIIEDVTGKNLGEAFNEIIYQQLNLTQTFHPEEKNEKAKISPAFVWNENKILDKPLLIQSFRDLYSTAEDLLKFMRALVQGKLFKQQSTFELMQQWNRLGFPKDKGSLRQPGWPIEYGYGMMRFKLPRWLTPFKSVPAVIGHTGSTGSWLFFCPEKDFYFCGTVDQVTAGAMPFRFIPKLLNTIG